MFTFSPGLVTCTNVASGQRSSSRSAALTAGSHLRVSPDFIWKLWEGTNSRTAGTSTAGTITWTFVPCDFFSTTETRTAPASYVTMAAVPTIEAPTAMITAGILIANGCILNSSLLRRIAGVGPNPHVLRLAIHCNQLHISVGAQGVNSGQHIEFAIVAGK